MCLITGCKANKENYFHQYNMLDFKGDETFSNKILNDKFGQTAIVFTCCEEFISYKY